MSEDMLHKLAELNNIDIDAPTADERRDAQILWTALMTDSLLPEEGDE